MAKKLSVINELRPRIVNKEIVDHETIAGRISKNTTYNINTFANFEIALFDRHIWWFLKNLHPCI